jgi:hypothetical protein
MPYNPGLGQGHGKKRHLHAHSPVNFKELKCYKISNDKAQMSNQAQSPNDKRKILAFRHYDFIWHLDFDIWA